MEGTPEFKVEDGGHALIMTVNNDVLGLDDSGIYARIISWDENNPDWTEKGKLDPLEDKSLSKYHQQLQAFNKKMVRITIEEV